VQYVFENLARLLRITETDILFEVGSNDGKVLISCCKQVKCRCVGIEVCESAVWKARDAAVRSMLLPACISRYLHSNVLLLLSSPLSSCHERMPFNAYISVFGG
jgi:hypothetical protein